MNATNFRCFLFVIFALLLSPSFSALGKSNQQKQVVVEHGIVQKAIEIGGNWTRSGSELVSSASTNCLVAGNSINDGDFQVNLHLSIDSINSSSAQVYFAGSYFIFDAKPVNASGKPQLAISGVLFPKYKYIGDAEKYIRAGVPFDFKIKKKAQNISFYINDNQVFATEITMALSGYIALQTKRNRMKVSAFSIQGKLSPVKPINFLYECGKEGYFGFRIPAIVTSTKGTLLAFAEGRKNSLADTGDIDLVLKRSEDNGKTWSKLSVIWNDSLNVCGNPCPVVDKTTGTIYLICCWNLGTDFESVNPQLTGKDPRRIFVIESTNDGKTWSKPREITKSAKEEGWAWYATGPCHGVQLERSQYRGRLIIPCNHIDLKIKKNYTHAIYSDDHGKTWKLGSSSSQDQVNECSLAELPDGKLMLNMRNFDEKEKYRKVSVSTDGGMTWGNIYSDKVLIEPICQGNLFRYSFPEEGKSRLLFSNPADETLRRNVTLRLSYDEGSTWAKSMVLYAGPSAYSDLTRLSNENIGCLYEAGYLNQNQCVVFQEVSLKDLEK